jgi:hypothetical protein
VVFVKMLDEMRPHIDVNKIGVAIVNHVKETGESISRFACRFFPVDLMCKAGKFEEFKVMAKPIIEKYFKKKEGDEEIDKVEELKVEEGDEI